MKSVRTRLLLWTAMVAGAIVAAGTAVAADKIPRLDGKPDFSGIWQTTSAADFDLQPHSTRKDAPPGAGIVVGNTIPYLPAALEQKQKNFAARAKDDPRRPADARDLTPFWRRRGYRPLPNVAATSAWTEIGGS